MSTKIIQKNIDCPICHIGINWKHTNVSGILRGICPKCGMGFIDNNGMIVSDPKYSKK